MDNLNTGENLEKTYVEPVENLETFTVTKEDWERLSGKVYNLDRVAKNFEKNRDTAPLDKETLKSIEELTEQKRVKDFARDNNLPDSLTEQLFKFKPNLSKDDLQTDLVKDMVGNFSRRQRVDNNTPSSTLSGNRGGKDFRDLNADEKQSWFNSKMGL